MKNKTTITVDRKTIFLATHVLQESDIYTGYQYSLIDSHLLVYAYLYGAAIANLKPCWIASECHNDAWEELNRLLNGYKRDSINFAQAAISTDPFENKTLYEKSAAPMISMWAIGVLQSDNQRDMKFALRAMRAYFKRAFPDAKTAAKTWDRQFNTIQKSCLKKVVQAVSSISNKSEIPINDILSPMVVADISDHKMRFITDYIAGIGMETDIWIYLMVGKNSNILHDVKELDDWEEEDFPERLTERVISVFHDLNPTPAACLRCMEAFRPLLTQLLAGLIIDKEEILSMGKEGLVENDLSKMAQKIILPMLEKCDDLTNKMRDSELEKIKNETGYKQQIAKMEEELASVRKLASLAEQTEAIRTRLAAVEKETQSARAEVRRLSAELAKSIGYTQKLESCLEESEIQRKELDGQLANLMDNRDELVQSEAEEQISPSGVRERIGEDAYQLLCGKRLAIVGGHTNTHITLRELFPGWQYYAAEAVLRDSICAVDAVVCITTYTSHKSYHQAKDRAKTRGLDFIPVPRNGPTAICQQLAEYFAEKERVA